MEAVNHHNDDASDQSGLLIENQLCFALYDAMNAIGREYRLILDPLNITFPQYLSLMVLWEESPRTVGVIADSLNLKFGTVSPLLQRLEANGFVRRERDVKDERKVLVYITERGLQLRNPALKARNALAEKLGWSTDELAELRKNLSRLSSSIGRRAD